MALIEVRTDGTITERCQWAEPDLMGNSSRLKGPSTLELTLHGALRRKSRPHLV